MATSETITSESSFLMSHQHILGYLVPYDGENVIKMLRYNRGYLDTINMNYQNAVLKIRSSDIVKSVKNEKK